MKIHSNLRAGRTFEDCDAQRSYMKWAAKQGDCSALNQNTYQNYYPTKPSTKPAAGGYYQGVFYSDRSGSCS